MQLARGPDGAFDTPSYWSATTSTQSARYFSTTLQPGFSSYTVIEFLDRGGRLPFTDLAYGYPFVCGILAMVLGSARLAMILVTATGVGATVAIIGMGPRQCTRSATALALRALVALVLVASPTFRMVTRGTLTEPIFCAVTLGSVLCLSNSRDDRSPWKACLLAGAAGAMRFVGVALAPLLIVVCARRMPARRAVLWGAAAAAPGLLMSQIGAVLGGGHVAGWRGFHDYDFRLFARSVGGWVDARQGNPALTYMGQGASWWAWPLAACWCAVVGFAAVGLIRRRGGRFGTGSAAQLCLVAAAALTVTLAVSIAFFDSLAVPENRLLLPMEALAVAAIAWSRRFDRMAASSAPLLGAAVAVWAAASVWAPGNPDTFVTESTTAPAIASDVSHSGASVVISPVADSIHWWTGVPAAYLPQPVLALTGEGVDVVELWEQLPCAMAEANAAIVIPHGMQLDPVGAAQLARLQSSVALVTEEMTSSVMLWSTSAVPCS